MADITLQNVSKSFGDTRALDDVSLTVANGDFVVLLGPTGAGKTTTLRLISGLERPETGDILINGRSVLDETPAQRDVAMVFQQYSLYPHMTVRDNLAFPLRSPILKTPEHEVKRKIDEVFRFGVAFKEDSFAVASSQKLSASTDNSGAIVTVEKMSLAPIDTYINAGHFKRILYFARRIPNTSLLNMMDPLQL